jgi:AcrR family transcriptional regulator
MRNEILLHAEQQMKMGGFENLNFGTIAKNLETTRANLHYHFKNKESLAIEVATNYSQKQFEDFKQLSTVINGDFFAFAVAAEKMFWQKSEELGSTSICVVSKMAIQPGLPDSLQDLSHLFYRKFEELHIQLLEHAVKSGQIRNDIDIQREAHKVHILIMGMMTCGQMIGDVKQAKKELSGFLEEWAHGLK